MRNLTLLIAVCTLGCKKDTEERPSGEPAGSASGSASGTPTGSGTAAAKAGANPDWPCSNKTQTSTEPNYRFTYDGPKTCTTTPDLVAVGCPTLETLDDNGDGAIDRWRTFTYDAGNHLVGVEYRREVAGPVTTRLTIKYAADATPERSDIDQDADGKIEGFNIYKKKDGKLVREFDRDADGKVDLIGTTTFDDQGRILETTIDHGAVGKTAATGTYRWEGARLVEDVTAMGDMKIVTTYSYDCAP